MIQRKTEWLNPDSSEIESYFLGQWNQTYRNTIMFYEWLNNIGLLNPNQTICDLGCGAGSNTYYLWKNYDNLKLLGIDLSPKLIDIARDESKKRNANEIIYEIGNLYNLSNKYKNKFDGVIMVQVFSWIPDGYVVIKKITNLNPQWIAFSCLLNDSLVETEIRTKDYSRTEHGNFQEKTYNIYSIERIKKMFLDLGYDDFNIRPFEIDIDIDRNKDNKGMGTYTQKLDNGKRIQISGGILLNWYFVAVRKTKED